MAHTLEVIVTSADEAIAAEAGGADRLELVRDLAAGGLTPRYETVAAVLGAVALPVRVMLRETPSMALDDPAHVAVLRSFAQDLSSLPIDGFVLGFLKNESPDLPTLEAILSAAPDIPATFHRAFDELDDPVVAIEQLRRLPQIDRILTVGGCGDWTVRKQRLLAWQRAAQPAIRILVGAGLSPSVFADLAATPDLHEVHVGRGARIPPLASGVVDRDAVRSLTSVLAAASAGRPPRLLSSVVRGSNGRRGNTVQGA